MINSRRRFKSRFASSALDPNGYDFAPGRTDTEEHEWLTREHEAERLTARAELDAECQRLFDGFLAENPSAYLVDDPGPNENPPRKGSVTPSDLGRYYAARGIEARVELVNWRLVVTPIGKAQTVGFSVRGVPK